MPISVLGLHHVTATVDEAQADLDFCIETLGLRLVKKTVNFDNHHVYHFYYGDERGAPGTIWTTFPYRGHGVPVGAKGAGQIGVTAFSVPPGSLPFWRDRLRERRVATAEAQGFAGEEAMAVLDPSGLVFTLVASERDTRTPWSGGGIDAASAIRGLHSVTMTIRVAEPTIEFMASWLGFRVVARSGPRVRLSAGADAPGHFVDLDVSPEATAARNGLGTVHHVAFAVASAEEQQRLRDELLGRGVMVTDIRDRQDFQSIYFREPGGVLFEIATIAPGFTVDEELARLGRQLKLPPWEEPHRASIETHLAPIHYR